MRKFPSLLIQEIQERKHVSNSKGMYSLKTSLNKLEPQTSRKKEIAEGEQKLEESGNYRFQQDTLHQKVCLFQFCNIIKYSHCPISIQYLNIKPTHQLGWVLEYAQPAQLFQKLNSYVTGPSTLIRHCYIPEEFRIKVHITNRLPKNHFISITEKYEILATDLFFIQDIIRTWQNSFLFYFIYLVGKKYNYYRYIYIHSKLDGRNSKSELLKCQILENTIIHQNKIQSFCPINLAIISKEQGRILGSLKILFQIEVYIRTHHCISPEYCRDLFHEFTTLRNTPGNNIELHQTELYSTSKQEVRQTQGHFIRISNLLFSTQ